jgi:hypothetical protein
MTKDQEVLMAVLLDYYAPRRKKQGKAKPVATQSCIWSTEHRTA